MSEAPAADPFPWDAALAFALGVLRWTPDAVWRATPRELAAAASAFAPRTAPPAGRDDLARLLQAFPDVAPPLEDNDGRRGP